MTVDHADAWSDALVALSNCLRRPDESVQRALEDDAEAIPELLAQVGVEAEPVSTAGRDLTEDYEALFGAFATPFAPPAASPYKEWYGDRSGLMDGPPATAMEQRYDALDVTVPDAYPADHVALQLEYASLLAEAQQWDELAAFVDSELDWIDAFAELVDDAAAQAPLQRWCVQQLVATIEQLREELDVDDPDQERVEQMASRARTHVSDQ
ncbi:putative component of anaerobic dehydrogenase [Halapricum desulfuricans]|uniref:Putative component of anaerobic dehydrogenase n=2 Tax=Halapricum desulfuricans TaxID=2841257 RepID=A0A897NTA9_9EURY|nr:putative component of anaerobic dehydrogenase [Halapricum desulfuricans]